ncbi:MAG: nucleotide sugar dehydrogenase [Chloroflexaceae bacterium]|nr:nucleotide sugar dehydrogenase [Chloroflexaceae bacterium]
MKVSIFGLGYVGCVSAACLAREGHTVIGVDINPLKVEYIASGRSPIIEPGLDEMIAEGVRVERLRATTDSEVAVHDSDISIICVGTPSNENGSLKITYLQNVCREIGKALAVKNDYHVVVVRSTVLPSTVQEQLVPVLEEVSHKLAGTDFGVSMNPEFLREGSAIADYYSPSHIIIGAIDQRSGDLVQQLYNGIEAPLVRTDIPTAEMVKYADNAFHALKVVFANEIGTICKAHNIDGQEVMRIFCQDRRLNLSPYYLRPGFAFGGSCLPKDLRALLYRAKERDIDAPMLSSILPSNQRHVHYGIAMIERAGRKKVGILGLSFKAGTDDVRESPMVTLIETLVGRGYDVRIYDENVRPDNLIGANRSFLEREIPHIASLMLSSVEAVVEHGEVLVIANGSTIFSQVPRMMHGDQILIDLVGIAKQSTEQNGIYQGICW